MAYVNHFPEDVQMEVISKLPVKSILKFRSVSRAWMFLLSDKSMEGKRVPSCVERLIFYPDLLIGSYHAHIFDLYVECTPVLGKSLTSGTNCNCATIARTKLMNNILNRALSALTCVMAWFC